MATRYFAVIGTNNVVLIIDKCDDTAEALAAFNEKWAAYTLVEIKEPAMGQANPVAGCLYYGNSFWYEIKQNAEGSQLINYTGFRNLFTNAEQVKIDNYDQDVTLTDAEKAQFRTDLKNVDNSQVINMADPHIAAFLDRLVTLQYITAERQTAIMGMIPPTTA